MLASGPIFRLASRYYRRSTSDVFSSLKKPSSPLHNIIKSVSSLSVSPPKSPVSQSRRVLSRSLKLGSLAALAATTYVSYAYSLEEVHDYTKHFRGPDYVKLYGNTKGVADEDPAILQRQQYNNYFTPWAVAATAKAMDCYLNVRCYIHELVEEYIKSPPDKLLPDIPDNNLYTLVLDLSETLVHSDWNSDLVRGNQNIKRPGLDAFLERVNDCGYEVVLYTDEFSLNVKYLLDSLTNESGGSWFKYVRTRGSTVYKGIKLFRDLSRLNRDPSRILYVSGHALENCLQPKNCVPIKPWKKEVDDTTLTDLLPFLEYVAEEKPTNIRPILKYFEGKDIATTYVKGSKIEINHWEGLAEAFALLLLLPLTLPLMFMEMVLVLFYAAFAIAVVSCLILLFFLIFN